MGQETRQVPTPEQSSQRLEEMLAAREAEQPGFRAAWEAFQKKKAADDEAEWKSRSQEKRRLVQSLEQVAKDLPSKHRDAFHTCMTPEAVGSVSLPNIAQRYRRWMEEQLKDSIPPGELTGGKRNASRRRKPTGLRAIESAANTLRIALLQSKAEVLDEIQIAGHMAQENPDRFPELLRAGRAASAWDLPKEPHQNEAEWVQRLKGLEDLAGWLADEASNSKEFNSQKRVYDIGRAAPEMRLFRAIAELLWQNGLGDDPLRPLARVVRAWYLHVDLYTQENREPLWADRCGRRVKEEREELEELFKEIKERTGSIESQSWSHSDIPL